MNKILLLAAALLLDFAPVFGQPAAPVPPLSSVPTFAQRLTAVQAREQADQNPAPALTKFSLDFPDGTPSQLAQAIEKAMGKPLNVIIPAENADVVLPPLKLNDVVVPQLFTALGSASRKTVENARNNLYQPSYSTEYGFRTADGQVTDASIWYFYFDKPSLPPDVAPQKECRFFSLAIYLNRGYTVDDITTAIQTGWKLSGDTKLPELNYHKETKLLIAYGESYKLSTIDQVLGSLQGINVSWQDYHSLQANMTNALAEIKTLEERLNAPVPTDSTPTPKEKTGN